MLPSSGFVLDNAQWVEVLSRYSYVVADDESWAPNDYPGVLCHLLVILL